MKRVIVIVVILVLFISGIIVTKNIIDNKRIIEASDDEELDWWIEESKKKQKTIKKYKVSEEMIIELTKSNPKWSKIDISKESLNKIKEKYPNGIFNGEEYDEVKLKEDYNSLVHDSDMGGDTIVLIAIKGKKVDEWIICGECGDILSKDRFGIYEVEKKEIYDETGSRIKYPMDEEHWLENIQKIALQDNEEVGKSEDFYERYPDFTGIINPYHYDSGINVKWDYKKINYINKEIFCDVYYTFLAEDYKFRITYVTDDKNFLQDFNVDILEKSEHYFKEESFDDILSLSVIMRIIYNDRSFEKINISKNFKNNFNNSIYKQYHIVDIYKIIKTKEIKNKCIVKVRDINNNIFYLGLKYIIKDNKIDNALGTRLNIAEEIEEKNKENLLSLF